MERQQSFMTENSLTPKLIINYKTIEHERFEDAPFVGALISACDCKFNCKNCFNQNIKNIPTKQDTAEDIIKQIKSNPFNKGIIFAGLEWTLQIDECLILAKLAKQQGLQTMLYTGNDSELILNILKLCDKFDYIKVGRFIEELKTANHIEYGVVLASSNQHILKKGIDY